MANDSSNLNCCGALDFSLMTVRVIAGAVFIGHGAQKLFGWFNGPGMEGVIAGMGKMGLPSAVVWAVAICEFAGGVALVLGLFSRLGALVNLSVMAGAIAMVHGQHGFFMNTGDPKAVGFEFNLALIGLLVPTLLLGPGRWSLANCLGFLKNSAGRPHVVVE